jgi:hypothetical protein
VYNNVVKYKVENTVEKDAERQGQHVWVIVYQ